MKFISQKLLLAGCCLSFLWIQGCATIMTGSTQSVGIKTNPSEAKFTIKRNGEPVHAGVSPQVVELKKRGKYSILIEKEGYDTIEVPIKKRLSAWYIFGNIVFGGLIGYIIVDPISGAIFTFPEKNTSFTLNKKVAAMEIKDKNKEGIVILSLNDIPQEQRKNLVSLK